MGPTGSRVRLFKLELQKLADETGLTLQVCHFPPGTSSRVDATGAVAVGREDVGCIYPALAFRLLPVPYWFAPWLRFQSPLVKPDMQISRIRRGFLLRHPSLPRASARSARLRGKGKEAKRLVEILCPDTGGIRCPLVRCVAPTIVADAVEPHTSVLQFVGRENRPFGWSLPRPSTRRSRLMATTRSSGSSACLCGVVASWTRWSKRRTAFRDGRVPI